MAMALNRHPMSPLLAAKKAVAAIGWGYDLTTDLRFSACKAGPDGSRLIDLEETATRDIVLPGGVVVPDVPSVIKSDKGERTRFRSDVLSFNQMAEHFNQGMGLSGKVPSGAFNTMFNFSRCWQTEASATKALAFDGWFITLYTIELSRSHVTLSEHVKKHVPSSWDPTALAAFIEKYGTHVIVGVKMGGKDVIYLKQLHGSNKQPAELLQLLMNLADQRFSEGLEESLISHSEGALQTPHKDGAHGPPGLLFVPANSVRPSNDIHSKNQDVVSIKFRRGGVDSGNHKQWFSTIVESPNVISMSFVPITSLLNGVQGSGFLNHAINLYLRYKPQIEELAEFLDFQLPRQWAPAYGELPLGLCRKKNASPSLQYGFMGPKLYISTDPADTGDLPVTGIRLFLEGKKSDHLAIHLQHLSALPRNLQLSEDNCCQLINRSPADKFIDLIQMGIFSHVCTAVVEHNGSCIEDSASIVTKAWLEVKAIGMKKVLFLRLGFSMVGSAKLRRSEWEGPSSLSQKSGIFYSFISGRISQGLMPPYTLAKPDINSAVYAAGPPKPTAAGKLSSIVDTREMVRGPEDHPGYWVVTGARLCVENGKITIKAKYSLLTIMSEDSTSI